MHFSGPPIVCLAIPVYYYNNMHSCLLLSMNTEPAGSQKTILKSANSHKTSLGHHSDKKRTVLSGSMQELQEHNMTRKKTGTLK